MNVPLLDLKAQYKSIRQDINRAMAEVCESQYFIGGPKVVEFEEKVAKYCGSKVGVGVSSGTDALLVALMALGVGPGDGVITTPYTFFATAGCVARLGAVPIFVDIDPMTYNIDANECRRVLERLPARFAKLKIKVLLPVHLYGQMAEMEPLMDLAREFNLKVIEDAAQAIGAQYLLEGEKRRAGSIGDVGCFSFFPSKNLGGFGDGGMVVSRDEALGARIRDLRNHGANPKYYHKLIGGNFRLDAIQAAVLGVKLTKLEAWHAARRKNAQRYDRALKKVGVVVPMSAYKGMGLRNHHIYNQYIVRVPNRDEVRHELQSSGIGCEVYYPVPLHLQRCFKYLKYQDGDFPESERAAKETLALPIYPELTDKMQDHVVGRLLAALRA